MTNATITEPAFVNLQTTSVMVPDTTGRNLSIQPWRNRNAHDVGGTFVVYGLYYQQFVSGAGPLYPFPGDRRWLDEPAMEQGRGVDPSRKFDGDPALDPKPGSRLGDAVETDRVAREAVAAGTSDHVAEATIHATILAELKELGITTAEAFNAAPAAVLLTAHTITMVNLPRLRESIATLFPESPAGDPDAVEGEEEGDEEYTMYSRAKVEQLTLKGLTLLVEAEGFELVTKKRRKPDLLEEVLGALTEYEQLED